jgi:hypothetical protein
MYRLKRGDIILFRSGKQLKAHRILARRGPSFITRGDTGMRPDDEIAFEDILGRVVAKQCHCTGATIALTGASFRLRFRVEEFKRSLPRAIVKLGVL